MKNIVKCYKHFFGYFNALETHSEYTHSVGTLYEYHENLDVRMHLHKICRNIVYSMLESFQEAPNDRQVAFVIDFYRFMTAISINIPLDMIIVANT